MTHRDLADAVGVTPAAVYQWEGSGESKTTPSQEHLLAVARAFRVSMAEFWGPVPKAKKAS